MTQASQLGQYWQWKWTDARQQVDKIAVTILFVHGVAESEEGTTMVVHSLCSKPASAHNLFTLL